MSGRWEPTWGADACDALPTHHTPTASICTEHSNWRQERLREARGILADIAQHQDTLVVLACRVVGARSPEAKERADALGMLRLLRTRWLEPALTGRKGGAA